MDKVCFRVCSLPSRSRMGSLRRLSSGSSDEAAATLRELVARDKPRLSLETLTTTLGDRHTAAPFLHAVVPPLMVSLAELLREAPPQMRTRALGWCECWT